MSVILLVEIEGEVHNLALSHKPLVMGRSKKCNVRFADSLMSSKHCEVSLNDKGRIVVKDLNSTNGTFINDVKVEAGHVFIGDVLRVGNINITIDTSKLTRSEREALSDDNIKTKHRFVDLKEKKPTKTKVIADFTTINMAIPEELRKKANDKTYVMSGSEMKKKLAAEAKQRKKNSERAKAKRKEKIVSKDQTGIFKRIFGRSNSKD